VMELATHVLKLLARSGSATTCDKNSVKLVCGGTILTANAGDGEIRDEHLHLIVKPGASVLAVVSPRVQLASIDESEPTLAQDTVLWRAVSAANGAGTWFRALGTKNQLGLLAMALLALCIRWGLGPAGLMPLCIAAAYVYEDRARVVPWLQHVPLRVWGQVAVALLGLHIAVWAEFGFVYLLLCGFCLVFWNLNDAAEDPSRPSAYSVFNAGFAALPGQLTAQDFEREIRHEMY